MLEDKKIKSPDILERFGKLAMQRVESFKASRMYKGLALRVARTDCMMELRPYEGEYRGRYGAYLPIFKNTVEMWQSAIRTNLDNDPFVAIVNEPGTMKEIADNVQIMANWNIRETNHKQEFWMATDDLAKTGTGFVKHQYMVVPKVYPQQVESPLAEMEFQFITRGVGNDYTRRVHPLNYFQDTSTIDNDFYRGRCQYCGEFNRLGIPELMDMSKNEDAVKDAIQAEIKVMKDENDKDSELMTRETNSDSDTDYKATRVYVEMYGRFQVKDNEDDQRIWYVVVSEKSKKVIFCKQVFFHPYTRIFGRQRPNAYLGSGPCEGVAAMNIQGNLIHNKGLENLIHNMQRYIVYMKDSGLSPKDFQNTANNGYIPFDPRAAGVQQVSQAIQEFQGRDINVDNMSIYMGIINDYVQRDTHQSDLLDYGMRASVGKSLTQAGSSATAANIMDNRKQKPVVAFMNQIAIGQEEHWEKKIRSLQMNLPDYLGEEILGQSPDAFRKYMILGNVRGTVKSGYKTNKLLDLQNMQTLFAFIAQILPLAAQGGQQVYTDYQELIRSAVELGNFPNRDKVFPAKPPVQVGTQPPPPGQQPPVSGEPGGETMPTEMPQEQPQLQGVA